MMKMNRIRCQSCSHHRRCPRQQHLNLEHHLRRLLCLDNPLRLQQTLVDVDCHHQLHRIRRHCYQIQWSSCRVIGRRPIRLPVDFHWRSIRSQRWFHLNWSIDDPFHMAMCKRLSLAQHLRVNRVAPTTIALRWASLDREKRWQCPCNIGRKRCTIDWQRIHLVCLEKPTDENVRSNITRGLTTHLNSWIVRGIEWRFSTVQ